MPRGDEHLLVPLPGKGGADQSPAVFPPTRHPTPMSTFVIDGSVEGEGHPGTAWVAPCALQDSSGATERRAYTSSLADVVRSLEANPLPIDVGRKSVVRRSGGRTFGAKATELRPRNDALPLLSSRENHAGSCASHSSWGVAPAPCSSPAEEEPPVALSACRTRRQERMGEIEAFAVAHCARHVAEPQRNANFRRVLDDMARLHPPLSSLLLSVSLYLRDLGGLLSRSREERETALAKQMKELHTEYESFFEEKILGILREKHRAEEWAKAMQDEVLTLRRDRDEELTKLKGDIMLRLNHCERQEDELNSFRALIASVFKNNEQLTSRIEDLEAILRAKSIEVPSAAPDLFTFTTKGGPSGKQEATSAHRGSVPGTHRLPVAFMAASRDELNLSRLTLQQELLNCAFDDRSAFRLQVSGLKMEKSELILRLQSLEERIVELNRYIYEKRFLCTAEEGVSERPLTPRPCDVPFTIQSELGIDLRASTSDMFAELAATASNLRHQLSSTLLRLRQMTTVSEWMQERTLVELGEERSVQAVLPTLPVSAWPSIPHFLRTRVEPDVSNLFWSEVDTGDILLEFFTQYKDLRQRCRFVRDSKMVAPHRHQLSERRGTLLTRLDASKEEVQEREEAVPFGYVVSHFIQSFLLGMGPDQQGGSLVLPGTLNAHFTVRGEERVSELEFARFGYNLWWAAHWYKGTQPLCQLFLGVVNGLLPVEVFDTIQHLRERMESYMGALDTDGSHTFTYQRLTRGVLRLVSDLGAQVGHAAVLAVVQTFEAHQVPLLGGRLRKEAILARESPGVPDAAPGEAMKAVARGSPRRPGPRAGAGGRSPWQGASVLVRFWTRLVVERYRQMYDLVERALAPLVVESELVLGLYLLPIPEALARVGGLAPEAERLLGDSLGETTLHASSDAVLRALVEGELGAGERPALSAHLPGLSRDYMVLLGQRRAHLARGIAEQTALMETMLRRPLQGLPRLNRAVHFPFTVRAPPAARREAGPLASLPPGETSASGGTRPPPAIPRRRHPANPPADTAHASRERRPVARDAASVVVEEEEIIGQRMVMDSDMDLVEWYGFCFALRQQLVPFPEKIFSDEVSTPQSWGSFSAPVVDLPADTHAAPAPTASE